jgi:DNA-binding transcriptional ArsR family regulator
MATPADDNKTDRLLRALADSTRRSLLDRLRDQPGLTQGMLGSGLALTRQALSKHLAALEAAELVVTRWRGREKLHFLNPLPLQMLPQRWVTTTQGEHEAALAALKVALHAPPTSRDLHDPVVALLAAAPDDVLDGRRIHGAGALAAARLYLRGTADAMRAIAAVLPAAGGYAKPPDGRFSIAEHLQHLADIEELGWAPRFERLLAETRPRLPNVDGDRLAAQRDYAHSPWRGAARRFARQRSRTLRALARYDESTLAKPARFADRAATAGDVLAAMVAHDREHRAEMASLWMQRGSR